MRWEDTGGSVPWSSLSFSCTVQHSGWFHPEAPSLCEPRGRCQGGGMWPRTLPGEKSDTKLDAAANERMNLISVVSAPYRRACLGYFKTASGTPWTNRGPSGWASPPPFMYWLVWLGTIALTDGWFKSTWKSEEIFLPFWMSNSDSVT